MQRFSVSRLLAALSLLIIAPFVVAADTGSTIQAFAVFAYNASTTESFVFAINAVENGDIYFHMSAPAGDAWMGVGFGSQMSSALMLIAYPNSNGSGITISPRVAMNGNSEPSYYPYIKCEMINSTDPNANTVTSTGYMGLAGDMYADAVCHNATSWQGAISGSGANQHYSLDLTSKNQSFIFAGGPGETIQSDDVNAPLNRHAYHGSFTMDMTTATSKTNGSVPRSNGPDGTFVLQNAQAAFNIVKDNNSAQVIHAVLMSAAFLILFPLGSLLIRIFRKVFLHTTIQIIGVLFVLGGLGTGLSMTPLYNRTRNLKSAHQKLGVLVFAVIMVQFGIGAIFHMRFKRNAPVPWLRKIHLILGPGAMLLGALNGALGINLAQNSQFLQYYIVILVAIALAFFAVRGSLLCCGVMRRKKNAEKAAVASASTAALVQSDVENQNVMNGPGMYPMTTLASQPAPPPAYAWNGGQAYGAPQHVNQAYQQQVPQQYYPPPPGYGLRDEEVELQTVHVVPK